MLETARGPKAGLVRLRRLTVPTLGSGNPMYTLREVFLRPHRSFGVGSKQRQPHDRNTSTHLHPFRPRVMSGGRFAVLRHMRCMRISAWIWH